jgi:hypothetical protein
LASRIRKNIYRSGTPPKPIKSVYILFFFSDSEAEKKKKKKKKPKRGRGDSSSQESPSDSEDSAVKRRRKADPVKKVNVVTSF